MYIRVYSLSIIVDDSHGLLPTILQCRLHRHGVTHSVTHTHTHTHTHTPIIIRHYCTELYMGLFFILRSEQALILPVKVSQCSRAVL